VRKVADLPTGMQKLYTAKGGSRIAIADPGEKFEVTDVITDPDLPTRRLIFAGVAQDRAFIHYEEGGIAHSYIVELFRLESTYIAVGLWSGYRGPAKNIEELKELVSEEGHDSCQTEVKWQSVDQLCGTLEFAAPPKKHNDGGRQNRNTLVPKCSEGSRRDALQRNSFRRKLLWWKDGSRAHEIEQIRQV